MTKSIIGKLSLLSSIEIPKKDPELEKTYNTLKDAFNAFDKDGSAQLGFEEYAECWKFLGRPDDPKMIKQTWDSVDID